MDPVDYIIVGVFLVVTMGVGCYFAFIAQTDEQYMIGDRNFSSWSIGCSFFATYVSNIALISLPATMVVDGFIAYIPFIMLPLAGFITNKYFISVYRKKPYFSIYSYVYDRFGVFSSVFVAISYIFVSLTRIAIIIYLLGVSLHILMDIDTKWIILVICSLVCIYTGIGGIRGVIWTDVFQSFVLIIAVICFVCYTWYVINISNNEIIHYLTNERYISWKDLDFNFQDSTIWVLILYGFLSNLQGCIGEQSSVQRLLMAKSDVCAKRGLWIGIWLVVVIVAVLFLLGKLFYMYEISNLNHLTNVNNNGDFWVLSFIKNNIPHGLLGLFVAAILSSSMSSIDSEINSISVIYLTNIHKELFKKRPNLKQSMFILKTVAVFVAIIAVLISSLIKQKALMVDAWWSIDSLLSGSMLGMFLLLIFFKKINYRIMKYAILISVMVACWAEYSNFFPEALSMFKNPFNNLITIFLTAFSVVFIGISLNLLRKG